MPRTIEIGLSTVNNDFGVLVYTGTNQTVNTWKPRIVNFTAPNNGKYIAIRVKGDNSCNGGTGTWVKVDNFCLQSDSTDCLKLPEVNMPNVFTPNGDGINDIFEPIVYEGMVEGYLNIYNRWGKLMYENSDPNIGWSGQLNNEQCSEGVYFWVIRCRDIFDEVHTFSGTLNLIR